MLTKKWYESKILWLQVLTLLVGAVEYLINNNMFPSCIQWILFADAILTAAIRIFFTDTKLVK